MLKACSHIDRQREDDQAGGQKYVILKTLDLSEYNFS